MTKEERDKLMNDPCVLHHKRDGTEEIKVYRVNVGTMPPEETEEFIRSMMRKLSRRVLLKGGSDYMLPERK